MKKETQISRGPLLSALSSRESTGKYPKDMGALKKQGSNARDMWKFIRVPGNQVPKVICAPDLPPNNNKKYIHLVLTPIGTNILKGAQISNNFLHAYNHKF